MTGSALWLRGLGAPAPVYSEPASLEEFLRRSEAMKAARRHPSLDDGGSLDEAADHISRVRAAVIEQSDDALDLLHATLNAP